MRKPWPIEAVTTKKNKKESNWERANCVENMEFTSILKLITKYIRLGRDILVPEENMCRSAADGLVHVT